MKNILPSFLLLLVAACPVFGGEEAAKLNAGQLIAEGVRLHDEGKFEDAILRFKRALEVEPDNAEALYELANTYAVTQRYDLCEEAARRGLKKPGDLEGPLFAVTGNCLSDAGKTRKAFRVFEEGLAKHPDDMSLNFNFAVRLARDGKLQQAASHFQKAIEAQPSYSSPYFALGEIAAAESRFVPGIFFLMRFVSLEPGSERAEQASAKVFELLTSGVSTKGEKEINITVSPDLEKTGDAFAGLELARAIAAATIHIEEGQSKAQRFVSALDNFVKIAEEMSQGEAGMTGTFVWKRAAAPVIQLQKRGVLECFGYVLAAKAGFDGAEEWLKKNPQKTRELSAVLVELSR